MQTELGNLHVEESLGNFDGKGLPEMWAIARQKQYEEKHNCQLRFSHVRTGGFSFYPKGHPKFKIEPPSVSVWKVVQKGSIMNEAIEVAPVSVPEVQPTTAPWEIPQEGIESPASAPVKQ